MRSSNHKTSYAVLYQINLSRLTPEAEEFLRIISVIFDVIVEWTADQIFGIRQIPEKGNTGYSAYCGMQKIPKASF
jgi:hypothetical protein